MNGPIGTQYIDLVSTYVSTYLRFTQEDTNRWRCDFKKIPWDPWDYILGIPRFEINF